MSWNASEKNHPTYGFLSGSPLSMSFPKPGPLPIDLLRSKGSLNSKAWLPEVLCPFETTQAIKPPEQKKSGRNDERSGEKGCIAKQDDQNESRVLWETYTDWDLDTSRKPHHFGDPHGSSKKRHAQTAFHTSTNGMPKRHRGTQLISQGSCLA